MNDRYLVHSMDYVLQLRFAQLEESVCGGAARRRLLNSWQSRRFGEVAKKGSFAHFNVPRALSPARPNHSLNRTHCGVPSFGL